MTLRPTAREIKPAAVPFLQQLAQAQARSIAAAIGPMLPDRTPSELRRTKHFVTTRNALNAALSTLRNGDTLALKPGVHFTGIDLGTANNISITVEAERAKSASNPLDDIRPIYEHALPEVLIKWRKFREGMMERKDVPLSFMDDMAESFHATNTDLRRAIQRMSALTLQNKARVKIIAGLAAAVVVETLLLARMSNL